MRKLFIFLVLVLVWACDSKTTPKDDISTTTGIPEIDKLLKAIEREPENPALFEKLSEAYYANEGYDEAINSIQKAIQLDSTQPAYFHLLADIYLNYNKSYEALTTVQRASGLFPDSINTLLNLAEIQMILTNYDASIQTTKRILEKRPMSDEAFYLMGMNMKYKGDTANALKAFQTTVERNADHLHAYQELAMLCDATGQDRLALQYFDNSFRIDSTDQFTLFNRANFHRKRRQDNAAIFWYQKAIEADKNFPEPYYNIGIIYLDYDSIPQARRHFDIAVQVEPTFANAYYYRGVTAEKMGDETAAINDYRQSLSFNPDLIKAKQALIRLGQEID